MTFSEIIRTLQQYFIFASVGLVLLIALFCIGYFVVYKRIMKGKRKLSAYKTLIFFLLSGYIFVLLYATLFSRGEQYPSSTNFHFFSSYLEAWNSFSLRSWQLLIFNIAFFIPLGALLPLACRKFERAPWIIGAGLFSTLLVESLQLCFGVGIFELDDIFNNLLGTIIGYCMIMIVLTIKRNERNKTRKIICCLLPILLVSGGFAGAFAIYRLQDFGNLESSYNHRINCKHVHFTVNTTLSDKTEKAMVYRTTILNKDSALKFAKQIYKDFGISYNDIDVTQYNDNAIYQTIGTGSYSLWIQYLGGTYSYTDYSLFDAEPRDIPITEAQAKDMMQDLNISIPESAKFEPGDEPGLFRFDVDFAKAGAHYCTGEVRCDVNKDNKIKSISNDLILLKEYKSAGIKSQNDACEEIKQGKFRIYSEEEINSIVISDVDLDYEIDSKGYYQPVYRFHAMINGTGNTITIPAIK